MILAADFSVRILPVLSWATSAEIRELTAQTLRITCLASRFTELAFDSSRQQQKTSGVSSPTIEVALQDAPPIRWRPAP